MLLNLYKKKWTEGLKLEDMQAHQEGQVAAMGECRRLSELYTSKVEDEMKKSKT